MHGTRSLGARTQCSAAHFLGGTLHYSPIDPLFQNPHHILDRRALLAPQRMRGQLSNATRHTSACQARVDYPSQPGDTRGRHNHARGNTTRLYKAIQHSCGKWPERSATRRESPILWRIGKGVGPQQCNQMVVFDWDSQRYEKLYLLDRESHGYWTRLITERALIEINRHVFRRYAGCPGGWLPTFTSNLHKFCIWCE